MNKRPEISALQGGIVRYNFGRLAGFFEKRLFFFPTNAFLQFYHRLANFGKAQLSVYTQRIRIRIRIRQRQRQRQYEIITNISRKHDEHMMNI